MTARSPEPTGVDPALRAALSERYSIEGELGRGGMATVYLAEDVRHRRKVALKVLHPELAAILGHERFLKEIEVTASLQHPHILPLFDSGEAGGRLYYVMPLVDGETLRARLEREAQLPLDDALTIAREVADALAYAHERGVIHRDIKPENILLQGGHAVVADFGIALAVQEAGGQRMTQTGLSLGTPQYMAPEQAMGDKNVDARADLYGLGAVLYEMLTGEPPFTGPTAQAIVARVLTATPAPPTQTRATIPAHVERAILVALAKLPADRFASARAFADALVNPAATYGVASTGGRPSTRTRARELVAWGVASVAVFALAVFVVTARNRVSPEPVEFDVTLPDSVDPNGTGTASSLAISRDGNTLVFAARRGTNPPMLYVRQLGDRVAQEIRGSENALSPVLSPNGSEVFFALDPRAGGFRASPSTTVRRVPIHGGVASTFTEHGSANGSISFGDNGRYVMAVTDSLFVGDVDKTGQTLLVAPDAKHRRYGFPDILPDGKTALIALWRGRGGLDSCYVGVVSLADGKVIDLNIRGVYPRYSSTGHILYFDARGGLFAVPFDARSRRVTGAPSLVQERVRAGPVGAAPLAVARNGTIAFLALLRDGPLTADPVIVDRTGNTRSIGLEQGNYRNPRVSPDGREIAFGQGDVNSGPTLQNPDIWRFEIATKTPQRVTTDHASDRPLWTRDGSRMLLFGRTGEPVDSVEMGVALSAGAQPVPYARVPGGLGGGDVGPRGSYAAFTVVDAKGDANIWIAPLDSLSKWRPFLAEPYAELFPRISPDGRVLAYTTSRTGRYEVYLRQLPAGGDEVKVSNDGGSDPAWSADGHELFYRTNDSMVVVRVNRSPTLSASGRQALFSVAPFEHSRNRSSYDVLPNGRELVMLARPSFSTSTKPPSIVVRTNWASAMGARKSVAPK